MSHRSCGTEWGGDACADEAAPEGLSQGSLEELLGASKQRRFAALVMVEVIVLPHTQLPKPHKKKILQGYTSQILSSHLRSKSAPSVSRTDFAITQLTGHKPQFS